MNNEDPEENMAYWFIDVLCQKMSTTHNEYLSISTTNSGLSTSSRMLSSSVLLVFG